MKSFLAWVGHELKENALLVAITAAFIGLSFSIYLFLGDAWIERLGREDGFFETATALFFLVGSIVLVRAFLRKRNWFVLLLAIVLFVGMGEEISWGQRIFGFATPKAFEKANVQGEFNLHNLEAVNSRTFERTDRTGWDRLLSINFLYKLFWFGYGIILPLGLFASGLVRRLAGALKVPGPPFVLGIFFLINYGIMKVLGYALPPHPDLQYLDTLGEAYECGTALVFLAIALFFLRTWGRPSRETVKPV